MKLWKLLLQYKRRWSERVRHLTMSGLQETSLKEGNVFCQISHREELRDEISFKIVWRPWAVLCSVTALFLSKEEDGDGRRLFKSLGAINRKARRQRSSRRGMTIEAYSPWIPFNHNLLWHFFYFSALLRLLKVERRTTRLPWNVDVCMTFEEEEEDELSRGDEHLQRDQWRPRTFSEEKEDTDVTLKRKKKVVGQCVLPTVFADGTTLFRVFFFLRDRERKSKGVSRWPRQWKVSTEMTVILEDDSLPSPCVSYRTRLCFVQVL